MDAPTLTPMLNAMNPWWTTGRVPERDAPAFRRSELKDFLASVGRDRIPILAGLRRTGKTTIMHQAIAELINDGMDPRRALYVTFDDLVLREMGPGAFQAVLDAHSEATGTSHEDTTYAFFDEVQNIPDWATALKIIWDRKGPLHMVASGSSGLLVRGAVGESLAGRAETKDLGPMDLADWATFLGGIVKRVPLETLFAPDGPGKGLGDPLEVDETRRALRPMLGQFLLKGGLPEAVLAEDVVLLHRHLYEDVVERVILRDIPLLYGVKQPGKLGRLLVLIADKSGFPLIIEGLKEAVTLRRETVEDYLTYLIGSRIIIELLSYSGSQFSAQKRARKYYIADTGLQNAIMHRDARALADETVMGALAEQAVAIHLDRLARRRWERISYAPSHRGSEVDFVLGALMGPIPIECKHRANVRDREVERLDEYREAIGAEKAIMVTRDTLDSRGDCTLVPLWMFLLSE
jgi:predicted AAA+ superfamily ATPase